MPRVAMDDEYYMQQALKLALRGAGFVSPNPLAGCVIVKNGKIIAEGCHEKFGGPHAETKALKKIKNQKSKIKNCVVYINMEPCCEYPGKKTPPCVDTLIAVRPKRVVVGMKDPNPGVSGRGIRALRRAGIEVDTSVLVQQCRELNEPFTKWITTKKPFVVVKTAVTLDGALTFSKGTRAEFSSPESYARVHELRQLYDAIAVGIDTVLIDNPRLTTRLSKQKKMREGIVARNPLRIIFDTHLRVPEKAQLFQEDGKTIIFTGPKFDVSKKRRIEKKYPDVRIVTVSLGRDGHLSLERALSFLGNEGIASVQVEGGAAVVSSLLNQQLVDKMMVVVTPHLAIDPAAPRLFSGLRSQIHWKKTRWEIMGNDAWFIGYP